MTMTNDRDAVERVSAWLDENPESVGHDLADPPRDDLRTVLALARQATERDATATGLDEAMVERVRFILDFLRDMVRVGGVDRKEQLLAWKLIDEARRKLAALASSPSSDVVGELQRAADNFVVAWMCDDRSPKLKGYAIALRAALAKLQPEGDGR